MIGATEPIVITTSNGSISGNAVKTGWLMKRGEHIRNWRSRFRNLCVFYICDIFFRIFIVLKNFVQILTILWL